MKQRFQVRTVGSKSMVFTHIEDAIRRAELVHNRDHVLAVVEGSEDGKVWKAIAAFGELTQTEIQARKATA